VKDTVPIPELCPPWRTLHTNSDDEAGPVTVHSTRPVPSVPFVEVVRVVRDDAVTAEYVINHTRDMVSAARARAIGAALIGAADLLEKGSPQ
jgi:hypothetical protein